MEDTLKYLTRKLNEITVDYFISVQELNNKLDEMNKKLDKMLEKQNK